MQVILFTWMMLMPFLDRLLASPMYHEVAPDSSLTEQEKKNAPKTYTVSDQHMEAKRKALADVGVIATKIKCPVCEHAATAISENFENKTYRTEEEITQYLHGFCGIYEFPTMLTDWKHFQLRESEGETMLVPPTPAVEKAGKEKLKKEKAKKDGETKEDSV